MLFRSSLSGITMVPSGPLRDHRHSGDGVLVDSVWSPYLPEACQMHTQHSQKAAYPLLRHCRCRRPCHYDRASSNPGKGGYVQTLRSCCHRRLHPQPGLDRLKLVGIDLLRVKSQLHLRAAEERLEVCTSTTWYDRRVRNIGFVNLGEKAHRLRQPRSPKLSQNQACLNG